MIITNLKLTNFRNHKKFETPFGAGVNVIAGPNGAGKTNILEAVNLLSTGKSFRARYEHEMIYDLQFSDAQSPYDVFNGSLEHRDFSKVTGTIQNNNEDDTLEVTIVKRETENLSTKTFKVNGTPKRMYNRVGYLNTVLFTPQDLEIFTGSPSYRRRFMDDLLCQTDLKYKSEHNIYSKALRQRNKILEKINETGRGQSELSIWTEKILESGTYIQQRRNRLFAELNAEINGVFDEVSGQKSKTSVAYKRNEISEQRLEKHKEHEIYAKSTLVGPHRDDFDFLFKDYNIAHYGSRGQQRTAVFSLKVVELKLIKGNTQSSPVLLLDDIFSELDDSHIQALSEIAGQQQTIITTTHPGEYLHSAGNMQILL